MGLKKSRKKKGFTLLELLVVVAILAIVAGGLLVAYDGLEKKSALAQASHSIAAIDAAVRSFTSLRGAAPDNLDSLLAVTPGDGTQSPATITGGAEILTLSGSLAGKIAPAALTSAQRTSLVNAGITQLRYIDAIGNANGGSATLTTLASDGSAATVGNINQADIPVRIFDVPRPGANRNRGRGFSHALAEGDNVSVWAPGGGGIDNLKLGAAAADTLIAFGLGNNASILQIDATARGDTHISSAPIYPDVSKSEYARYILVYNVGPAGAEFPKARLQAVLDARGDFLDEELAEASGQKQ